MHFVLLTQYYPPEIGAPAVRLAAMAKALQTLGHTVEVVTALPNHPLGHIFEGYRGHRYVLERRDGVPVHRLWLYAATGKGWRRLLNYLTFTVSAWFGLRKVRHADILFVNSPPLFLAVPGIASARRLGAKVVFNVSDLWPDSVAQLGAVGSSSLFLRLAYALERWSYRHSWKVTAVTEGIAAVLQQKKGIATEKLLYLPNGVDTELFAPRPADHQLQQELGLEGKKLFLYAGNFGFAQGLQTVVKAAELLREYEEIAFLMIGAGSEKEAIVHAAQGLANVHIADPKPPEYIARLYSLATAGLVLLRDLPLVEGARPSKLFPVMASGVPVIYAGRGEGAELVRQAQAGWVVPPENPQALADIALYVATHPTEAVQRGQNGRVFAEAHYSWNTLVQNWLTQLQGETASPAMRRERAAQQQ